MRSLFLASWSTAALLGCALGQQSSPARAQEAATELNVNTRFGRLELAAEKVAPTARDAFMQRREAWGSTVRVADYEFAGLRMKGKEDAEMLVKIAWYRIDQGDLRVTTLKQQWHDFKGDWRLVDESRADGDVGLIGEKMPSSGPAATKGRAAQFPTIRLGEPPPASNAPAPIVPLDPNEADPPVR
jgi:hypothetical protein